MSYHARADTAQAYSKGPPARPRPAYAVLLEPKVNGYTVGLWSPTVKLLGTRPRPQLTTYIGQRPGIPEVRDQRSGTSLITGPARNPTKFVRTRGQAN